MKDDGAGKMSKGKAKHLVVISYDAFSEDNWEKASRLPNLSRLIKNGAFSTKLKSVYPTLTYVVHTTMMTIIIPLSSLSLMKMNRRGSGLKKISRHLLCMML